MTKQIASPDKKRGNDGHIEASDHYTADFPTEPAAKRRKTTTDVGNDEQIHEMATHVNSNNHNNKTNNPNCKKATRIRLEEERLLLEKSVEELQRRQQHVESQLDAGTEQRNTIVQKLTAKKERQQQLEAARVQHITLLQELQTSLRKSQEILLRLNGTHINNSNNDNITDGDNRSSNRHGGPDSSTGGLLSQGEIDQLTDEIRKQEEWTIQQQVQQQKQQENHPLKPVPNASKESQTILDHEDSSAKVAVHAEMDTIKKSKPKVSKRNARQKYYLFSEQMGSKALRSFWNEIGDRTNPFCLMSFLPCIHSESMIYHLLDMCTNETLLQDACRHPDLDTTALLRRQSLWNTCLDLVLMTGRKPSTNEERPTQNRDTMDCPTTSDVQDSPKRGIHVDPHTALCPYELAGVCADPYCHYQHLTSNEYRTATILPKELLPLPKLRLPPEPISLSETIAIPGDYSGKTAQYTPGAKQQPSQPKLSDEHLSSFALPKGSPSDEYASMVIPLNEKESGRESSAVENDTDKWNEFAENLDFISFSDNNDGANIGTDDMTERDKQNDIQGNEEDEDQEDFLDLETAGLAAISKGRHTKPVVSKQQSSSRFSWWLTEEEAQSLKLRRSQVQSRTLSFEAWLQTYGGFKFRREKGRRTLHAPVLSPGDPKKAGVAAVGRALDCLRVAIHAGRYDFSNMMCTFSSGFVTECNSRFLAGQKGPDLLVLNQIVNLMKQVLHVAVLKSACLRRSFAVQLVLALISDFLGRVQAQLESDSQGTLGVGFLRAHLNFVGFLNKVKAFLALDDHPSEAPKTRCEQSRPGNTIVADIKAALYLPPDCGNEETLRSQISNSEKNETSSIEYSTVHFCLLQDLMNATHIGARVRQMPLPALADDVLKPLWAVCRTYLRQSSTEIAASEIDSSAASLRTCAYVGQVIFGVFECAVDFLSSVGGDLAILSSSGISTLIQIDAAVHQIVASLNKILCANKQLPFFDLILTPLYAASIACSAQLGQYSKSQHRLESLLGHDTTFASSESIQSPDSSHLPSFVGYSEILWSQLVHLRTSLPLCQQVASSGGTAQPSSNMESVLTTDIQEEHKVLASRISSFGVHLRHVCLSGDWKLIAHDGHGMSSKQETANRALYKGAAAKMQAADLDSAPQIKYRFCSVAEDWPASLRLIPSMKERISCFPRTLMLVGDKIKVLDLKQCMIGRLPPSFGFYFPHLERLDISENNMTSLPESMVRLKSLKTFLLRFNQLTALPSHLPLSLRSLDVRNNALEEFQWTTLGCDELEELFLQGNPLRIPVDSARLTLKWPKLRSLQLDDTISHPQEQYGVD